MHCCLNDSAQAIGPSFQEQVAMQGSSRDLVPPDMLFAAADSCSGLDREASKRLEFRTFVEELSGG